MEGEIKNFIKVWITVIASLTYCYFISKNIPKGFIRLFSILPIVTIFTILPLNLSSIHLIGIPSFFITWLASFKLLLLSFDKGPLSSQYYDYSHPNSSNIISLSRFISLACLPIKIKLQNPSSQIVIKPKSPLYYALKVLLLALLIPILHDYKQYLHPSFILTLQWIHIYFIVEIILAILAYMARFFLGLDLEPPFDDPYLSTSLQDFWGRRWNLIVSDTLLSTVYEPVGCICTRIFGTRWAQHLALLAMFAVSGLMHELIYFYFRRVWPTWEVMSFFALHGICLAVQIEVKRCFSGRWRLHRLVSGPLTVGFVLVIVFKLFLPQYIRCGADVKAIREYAIMGEFVKGVIQGYLG
ncbi:hypothetical protein BVC80_917g54 [Macleaya cordata]|uniref:Wax synthase domain-containing protein n=1 Tax=Macleaya cordata TaxID=56857 RepID=A0A200QIV2_MACCD|nr:hypothetical protein BVC80_917g54 [Macleaya cordata]